MKHRKKKLQGGGVVSIARKERSSKAVTGEGEWRAYMGRGLKAVRKVGGVGGWRTHGATQSGGYAEHCNTQGKRVLPDADTKKQVVDVVFQHVGWMVRGKPLQKLTPSRGGVGV